MTLYEKIIVNSPIIDMCEPHFYVGKTTIINRGAGLMGAMSFSFNQLVLLGLDIFLSVLVFSNRKSSQCVIAQDSS